MVALVQSQSVYVPGTTRIAWDLGNTSTLLTDMAGYRYYVIPDKSDIPPLNAIMPIPNVTCVSNISPVKCEAVLPDLSLAPGDHNLYIVTSNEYGSAISSDFAVLRVNGISSPLPAPAAVRIN